jgi:2-methylcitrate dehydratase PrpD
LHDGKRFTYTAKIAKGHPQNPMTETEVEEKFLGNARSVISEERAAKLAVVVRRLEAANNLRQLTDLLVSP